MTRRSTGTRTRPISHALIKRLAQASRLAPLRDPERIGLPAWAKDGKEREAGNRQAAAEPKRYCSSEVASAGQRQKPGDKMQTSVNAGGRLDRLPISPFHRRVMTLIGIGMFFDGFDIYIAATVLGATLH